MYWKNMKKYLLIIIVIVTCIIAFSMVYGVFFSEWGERGWSKIANITIQEQGIKEVGEIDSVKIYTYDLSDVSFRHITAKEMSLEEMTEKSWVSIENLLYGQKSSEEVCKEKITVYTTESYQVIYFNEILIYAPVKIEKAKIIEELNHIRVDHGGAEHCLVCAVKAEISETIPKKYYDGKWF